MLPTEGTFIVDFWADWCGPCASIAEDLAELEAEGMKVLRFNVDEHRELAIMNGVQSIPTLIMFEDGKETARMVGAAPKSAMMAELGIVSK